MVWVSAWLEAGSGCEGRGCCWRLPTRCGSTRDARASRCTSQRHGTGMSFANDSSDAPGGTASRSEDERCRGQGGGQNPAAYQNCWKDSRDSVNPSPVLLSVQVTPVEALVQVNWPFVSE